MLAVLATVVLGVARAGEAPQITIGTGSVKGLYFPLAVEVCRIVNRQRARYGYRCTVRSTKGSLENIEGLRSGAFNFAFVQSNALISELEERNGAAVLMVMPMHDEPVHVMVKDTSDLRSISDMRERVVSFGSADSGSRSIAELIREHGSRDILEGVRDEGFTVGFQAQALCDERVDAVFWVAGIGNPASDEAARLCDARLLSFRPDWIAGLVARSLGVYPAVVPAGSYRRSAGDVTTFGPRAILAATIDTPDDMVADLAGLLWSSLRELRRFHRSLRDLSETDVLLYSGEIPLHPGALRALSEHLGNRASTEDIIRPPLPRPAYRRRAGAP